MCQKEKLNFIYRSPHVAETQTRPLDPTETITYDQESSQFNLKLQFTIEFDFGWVQ